ncbi:MAG: hypothetical protein HFJ74_00810 [Eggerthellaceae bacterium]|nr:hypothetical protein [Eggerthellaceae bacterium]
MYQRKPVGKELDYLRRLIDADVESGSNAVCEIISAGMERCQSTVSESHALDDDYRCITGLADMGMIKFMLADGGYSVGGLTSYGRYYFDEVERAEAEERRRIRGERRFQVVLAVVTALLSLIVAIAASWITADRLLETRLDVMIQAVRGNDGSRDDEEVPGHLEGSLRGRQAHVDKRHIADANAYANGEKADNEENDHP